MSEGNGNGNSAKISVMPGRNGGTLRRGNPGNRGRPRSEVRNMLVDEFVSLLPKLRKDVKDGTLSVLEYANLCARYGLGTTVTETDTEGRDVTPPPGKLTQDERRETIARILAEQQN